MLSHDGGKKRNKTKSKKVVLQNISERGIQLSNVQKKERALAEVAEAKALVASAKSKKRSYSSKVCGYKQLNARLIELLSMEQLGVATPYFYAVELQASVSLISKFGV